MAKGQNFSSTRRRPSVPVIVLIALLHVALFYGLMRALAPDITAQVQDSVVSAFTVTVTTPEEDLPEAPPEPDEGAQGDPGRDAVPQPTTAPVPPVPVRQDRPMPRASSTGTETQSGATESGDGTGAAGSGLGTGAGRGGGGQGGIAATKPVLIRSITDASAFPIPPGGREARIGKSVIVRLMVSAQGRVSACSIHQPSPFPATDAKVCELALDQVRFEPARDRDGNPVAAPFYYRQRFFN
ncbi:TonB family protein [Parerythrobacter jejuensis]|uniref:TonB family protein n=1 Tax=Parerythrobacter jejuensis TaxID=795812 RepID=A0A845AS49_9SPHN|nr:TonB family protein [Parerythrobacter jejuensis]MXP31336.1 TonB family protein [Parerythrobacter jejuensis]MXP34096.1 TonB family protein [Parerythrobacter jejuensis]